MSYEKFSAMTSALLVRKGQAAPSVVAAHIGPKGIEPVVRETLLQPLQPAVAMPQATNNVSGKHIGHKTPGLVAGTKRRVVLTLTNEEFERIGIAAVKRNVTRQQLAREALFTYLTAILPDFENCACLARKKTRSGK